MYLKNYIKIEDCKNGYVYLIAARNNRIGICHNDGKSFTISREKFKDIFLFDEYHYDTGAPFGTVHPILEIEKAPSFENDKDKLDWLTKFTNEYLAKKPCHHCGRLNTEDPFKCECRKDL
jgi:hypothetical protein